MSLIKLKDVSKFYYNKGIISTGFSKLNVEFNLGEFVVITGESGSGKSTLLNVISGLDSYEEGEMYINGAETSHYSEDEFENYRKKNISNIFQNFNLINSYTVYQNIELVLLINGYKKKEIKAKVLDLINKVDLKRYRKTKVSKLSGGQKQRVAIARSLAKNTPIIICDEPTGNLDNVSAQSIIKLLSEVAKDKLVVMVTHNYKQVEKYVTRKITMHDGKIIEDKKLTKIDSITPEEYMRYGNITLLNKIRLGIRNTFNIIPKFLLLFLVYFFIAISLVTENSSFKLGEYQSSIIGDNMFFSDLADNRIVLKKQDLSYFTDEDYLKIENTSNVKDIMKSDILLDRGISFNNEDYYFYSLIKNVKNISTVDVGTLPQNENEIVIEGYDYDYYLSNNDFIGKTIYATNSKTGDINYDLAFKVVGIKYFKEYKNNRGYTYVYLNESYLKTLEKEQMIFLSEIKATLNKENQPYPNIIPNKSVGKGKAFVSSNLGYTCSIYGNCVNKKLNINLENIYYTSNLDLVVSKMYNSKNFKQLTGLDDITRYNGSIFINDIDYYNLFSDQSYQISVYAEDVKKIDETINALNALNYNTLKISDTLYNYDEGVAQILNIINVIVTTILIIVLFFISYFIIKIILKSRNIYYSTLRILGSNKKVAKRLLEIELYTIANIAYGVMLLIVVLINKSVIKMADLKNMLSFMKINDYLLIYIIVMAMTYLIASKFSTQLFKKSAMKTYNEEV